GERANLSTRSESRCSSSISYKEQLGSSLFAAQYLQTPVPPGGNMLKREWLRDYEIPPAPQAGDEIVQTWDTAMKAGEANNYSVCLTVRVRNRNEYFLIDVFRDRLEFPELAKLVCAHAQLFRATAILEHSPVDLNRFWGFPFPA
ncbi:MAG TPA: hypothetical protein VGI59_10935, partial [Candidatus Udaeobacter sp.]